MPPDPADSKPPPALTSLMPAQAEQIANDLLAQQPRFRDSTVAKLGPKLTRWTSICHCGYWRQIPGFQTCRCGTIL